MKEKELLKLKNKIEHIEQEGQQLKGRLKELLRQLKEDFNCTSTKESKVKRKKLEKERDKIQQEIKDKLIVISEKYEKTQ